MRVARSVVSLLDAAAYLRDIPDDNPAMRTLADAGCFDAGVFDPGPEGAVIIRDWQLADEQTAGPAALLAALAAAAGRTPPGITIPAQMMGELVAIAAVPPIISGTAGTAGTAGGTAAGTAGGTAGGATAGAAAGTAGGATASAADHG